MADSSAVTRDAIADAAERVAPYLRRTPVIEVSGADFGLKTERLCFKLEFLQRSGAFKARGAFASLLLRTLPEAGVVAASGGNHGAAVACAAQALQVPASIFVPTIASEAKLALIRSFGARLVVGGGRYADALSASEDWQAQSGALAIHAYDQVETLLGQGTVGCELEQQAPDIDTLLVAVGGGGLIGGLAGWYRGAVKLVGVEPEGAPTLTRALEAGEPVDAPAEGLAADSLAPKRIGSLGFSLAQQFVAQTVLVSDDAIRQAQNVLWQVLRVVAEPGGAAAMAALLSGAYQPKVGERVAVLLCGANTTSVTFTG